jgi:hypothetical protein
VAILQQDVLGFDIAVNDTGRMRVRERVRNLTRDTNRFVDRDLALPRQPGTQCLAGHERHDVVEATIGISTVEKRKYVRMLKASRRLDLGKKAFSAEHRPELRVQYLDCDVAIVPEIAREIYRRHAAGAELAFHSVAIGERRS